jgi:hypothetical protein
VAPPLHSKTYTLTAEQVGLLRSALLQRGFTFEVKPYTIFAARKAPVLLLSDPSAPVSLPERAAIFNRKIANNEGGGDCLARAIAQLKDGSEDGHAAVRNAIANELLRNRSKFEVRRRKIAWPPGQ